MKCLKYILIMILITIGSALVTMVLIDSALADDVITKLQLPPNQLEIDRANMAAFVYMENTGVVTLDNGRH